MYAFIRGYRFFFELDLWTIEWCSVNAMRHTQRLFTNESQLERRKKIFLFVLRIMKWMEKNYSYIYYVTFIIWLEKKGNKSKSQNIDVWSCIRAHTESKSGVSRKFCINDTPMFDNDENENQNADWPRISDAQWALFTSLILFVKVWMKRWTFYA